MKIIADDKIPFLRGVIEPFAEVCYVPGHMITRETAAGADALLIRTRTRCNEALLKGSAVRFIGSATIGFDHIDTLYCEQNGIAWTNAPGCNSSSVCQYVVSALMRLSAEKKITLEGKTIGIIGAGNVGLKVEKAARALGMNVIINDPPKAELKAAMCFEPLEAVLEQADIITVHVPLVMSGANATFHLFDDGTFGKVGKKKAWLINTSRGEVVCSNALKKALERGIIAGAILDVWENEPYVDAWLLQNAFIATPHIAGYSADGKANGTLMVVNALQRFFNIEPSELKQDVPPPGHPVIEIETAGCAAAETVREAVFHSYDVATDSVRLKRSPATFETQRDACAGRREFTAYTAVLRRHNAAAEKALFGLGFNVQVPVV
ncbi:MAG: 4-phosphoerythronate dehydrogenase [Bacteroidales bacterium]|jgi:erythronate-4-phosphate dehydrogenase|nr:4-phosphoerythronate dehydrogenase [Bacteroidales bacterium]